MGKFNSVRIEGHVGKWSEIKSGIFSFRNKKSYLPEGEQETLYLLEHDYHGEDAMMVVDAQGVPVMLDASDGLDDIMYAIDAKIPFEQWI